MSWDDLRVLLAIHRSGSLLGASRLLGMSTSTTGRRVDMLEAAAGAKLVHRTQTGTELTPEALRLAQLAEGFEHGLQALQRDKQEAVRTIRLSVPTGMAAHLAGPLIALQRRHPNLDLELIGENRNADIARREVDIAIRLMRSTSSVLVEKHVVTLRFALFASRDYVRRRLPDARLRRAEAAAHTFIGLDGQWKHLPQEQWMASLGARRFVFRSSAIEAIEEATREGSGLAALLEQPACHADLVRIETETTGPSQPLYLVYHRDSRNVPQVRAVLNAIEASLKKAVG